MLTKALKAIAVAGFSLAAANTHAALVTLVGTTVNYSYETNDNVLALGLFGTPTIAGNEVRFLPPNFRAQSVDGAGTDMVSANFIFSSITSHIGFNLGSVTVSEYGDYEITNGDTVSADLYLLASDNNNYSAGPGDAGDAFDASGGTTGRKSWTMSAFIDPTIAFGSPTNSIALSIQNTLTATTNAFGEAAWIQKKLSFVASTDPVPDVPIPAAAWLFGSALLGLIGVGRRKKA